MQRPAVVAELLGPHLLVGKGKGRRLGAGIAKLLPPPTLQAVPTGTGGNLGEQEQEVQGSLTGGTASAPRPAAMLASLQALPLPSGCGPSCWLLPMSAKTLSCRCREGPAGW